MTTLDHGGDLDRAAQVYGGDLATWIDLSTGINPVTYPMPDIPPDAWHQLPLRRDLDALLAQARTFWRVPDDAAIVAAPGASALIAALPQVLPGRSVTIEEPTYNEHRAAFEAAGWTVAGGGAARVVVHPNNPDGRIWGPDIAEDGQALIIDESFCDTMPNASLVDLATRPNTVVLKSFGKFWGLAGLRLGFAICLPETAIKLAKLIGPWAVSGPALVVGTAALTDFEWADRTRKRLLRDMARLDQVLMDAKLDRVGGTPLFRLARHDEAQAVHRNLAQRQIWTRVFPAHPTWIRFGMPGDPRDWDRLAQALGV